MAPVLRSNNEKMPAGTDGSKRVLAQDGGALPPTETTEVPNNAVESRASSEAAPVTNEVEVTPLHFLNETTRKFASWDVSVAQPRLEDYTYMWDGKQRAGKYFRCLLVFVNDNAQYCCAEIRKTRTSPADVFEKAMATYKEGIRFRMAKVELNVKAKPEYNNASCKVTVDLATTSMTKLLSTGADITPQPTITCVDCLNFHKVQAFDMTALVEDVSEKRHLKDKRYVRDIYLIDGTLSTTPKAKPDSGVLPPTEESELIRLKVQIFYNTVDSEDDPEFVKTLLDAKNTPQPFHFYGLTAQFKDKGYQIETMRNSYLITPATGPRIPSLLDRLSMGGVTPLIFRHRAVPGGIKPA